MLQDLSSEDDHTEELTNLQTQGLKDGETDSDVQAAGCSGSPITVAEGRKGAEAAPHCYAPAAAIRGDAIPSEVWHVHEPKQLLATALRTDWEANHLEAIAIMQTNTQTWLPAP